MNDLEKEIRGLSLRTPGESLDARVIAALQVPASVLDRAEELPKGLSTSESPPAIQSARKGVVVTSGWIVACASMLTGIMIGRMMPPLVPHNGAPGLTAVSVKVSGTSPGSDEIGLQSSSDGAAAGQNASISRTKTSSISSQIMESVWLSPAAAVAVWEQQTGQIFNVATHIGDQRFSLSRDCHRVGG
jgi:hypothetical protein